MFDHFFDNKTVVFYCISYFHLIWIERTRGGFKGGGFSGIRPPVDPKGPPFGTF